MPNPLLAAHRRADAEFQDHAGTEIVLTFGQPQAEYAAIHRAAGIMDLAQRNVLELRGDDRLSFLNGILTSQTWDRRRKTGLSQGAGVYSFLLNQKGRILADMNVLETGDVTLLDMAVRVLEPTRKELEKYLFRERVSIENRAVSRHQLLLTGPQAPEVLNRAGLGDAANLRPLGGVPAGERPSVARVHLLGQDVLIWRDDLCGVPGFVMLAPVEAALSICNHFTSQAQRPQDETDLRFTGLARPLGWAAFNSTRIEAGRPVFGIDFDESVLPAETGQLQRAVSFSKGCYVGQEVVARMHSRGQVARRLVGTRMKDDALPIAVNKIYDEQSNEIGGITSSTMSPVLSDTAIALGCVKRGF